MVVQRFVFVGSLTLAYAQAQASVIKREDPGDELRAYKPRSNDSL